MKHPEQNLEGFLDRFFKRCRNLPAPLVDPAWERILRRLREEPEGAFDNIPETTSVRPARGRLWAAIAVAAATAIAAVLASLAPRDARYPGGAHAVIVEGLLFRTSNSIVSMQTGQTIEAGETVRSAGARDTVLFLANASWIEMRPEAELSLEDAHGGQLIRVKRGSLIVDAAKNQTARQLRVQTKDMTLSVAGTVFLVVVEEKGSYAAVLEGEVRVGQGRAERKLLRGEQVAGPKIETLNDEVAWSRQAHEHLARLKRNPLPLQVVKGKNSAEPHLAFEEVSIRARAATFGGKGGVLPGGFTPACYGNPQIDPVRFSISNTTVFQLIALAYGERCERWEQQAADSDALAGAPRWVREDRFDIQAAIPDETPAYTRAKLASGHAPEIQMMLQAMLADRFNLVLERRTKQMPVYVLTVSKGGPKLTPSRNARGLIRTLRMGADGQPRPSGVAGGPGGSMEKLASDLSNFLGRPVLDRTGITYEFSYDIEFALPESDCSSCPSPADALQDKLGLKLEATRAPVDVLVVNRVEKPSGN